MRRAKILRISVGAAVCVAAGLGVGLYARAAMNVPTGLAYSGLLRDGNGNVDNGMHTFVFDLLDGNAQPVGCSDTRANLAVVAGRFDVPNLFSSCNTLDTILATKGGLVVKITVDNNPLSPPQPLGTVPFAARARVAETTEQPQNLTTPDGVATRVATAHVNAVMGACNVDRSNGAWIQSCSSPNNAAVFAITFAPGTFSAIPSCVAIPEGNSLMLWKPTTLTQVFVNEFNPQTLAPATAPFEIICVGPR